MDRIKYFDAEINGYPTSVEYVKTWDDPPVVEMVVRKHEERRLWYWPVDAQTLEKDRIAEEIAAFTNDKEPQRWIRWLMDLCCETR